MPKIEVNRDKFYSFIGKSYTDDALEALLPCAKAELDAVDNGDGTLKIELNDTNRPDLWSTLGLARQLRIYEGGRGAQYNFFSNSERNLDSGERIVKVDAALKSTRPYMAAFAITGKAIDDATLKDIIQTQEKLCWNYGRKRKSIAMGVYRSDLFNYPVMYKAVDPDKTKFIPLGMENELSLREILTEHPKGQEYGHIIENDEKFPFITDIDGKVLSLPPVINSSGLGAVQVGDENLFIELTGTDLHSLLLAASIVACDLSDDGFTILPVRVDYPYETEFGTSITSPYYFQKEISSDIEYAKKLLGTKLSEKQIKNSLLRMGIDNEIKGNEIQIKVPEYRNDFLHSVDIVEDIMMGRGMDSFDPVMPSDSTVGRISPEEEFARETKDILIGLGFQEMIYNYLGSGKDYIEKMNITGDNHIQIVNPMTENYEFVRASIIPSMLNSEAISANAVYPHFIFEIGKIAFLDSDDNSGTVTKNSLGFLSADRAEGYNQVSSSVSAIFYYLNKEYDLIELDDLRFIKGRSAKIIYMGKTVGVFGEVAPQVLENWGIQMPATCCEIDLDILMEE
ncbi:MAG: phenylalanine--tRNA ligase subunit beta [Spirochaetia bacterium]|jgi:phenylalanyl-tRNA synthetase beta chain|nr:phenylalanine--tRNA ligase subunit beta [Spirochaetia bacterium]